VRACVAFAKANWAQDKIAALPIDATNNLDLFILVFPFKLVMNADITPDGSPGMTGWSYAEVFG
jgi:hypothetical protein